MQIKPGMIFQHRDGRAVYEIVDVDDSKVYIHQRHPNDAVHWAIDQPREKVEQVIDGGLILFVGMIRDSN